MLHAARTGYGETVLFEALDLTLPGAQTTCLLGPSGVGKSTLLRLLAGLLPPGDGDRIVCSDGGSLTGRTAYMDQRDLLLPWLKVLDNVTLGARLRHEPIDRPGAKELLKAVGLSAVAGEWPAHLSGGMRQRVALARTLMEDRPVVLMDEPFSALDAVTRYQLQALAARLLRGRTVLLVTHDPNEALRLGHRIRVLSGRPARLSDPLMPPGPPPRDPLATALRPVQQVLMRRLGMVSEQ
jgi:putative hydroxymethylpyrimidine transport system ATP-binding protein